MNTPAPPPSDAIAPSDPILSALKNYMAQCQKEHTARMDQDELGELIEHRAREIAAQPGPNIVAWTEKDGDEWIVYDAESDTGKHIRDYQKDSHFKDVFPIYDAPIASLPHVADALDGERLDYMLSAGHSVKRMEDTGQWMLLHDTYPVSGGEFDTPREAIDDEMRAIAARAEAGVPVRCAHQFVMDQEHVNTSCCQLCGETVTEAQP